MTIKAMVRDGRIEAVGPIPFSNGTVLNVTPSSESDLTPDDFDNSPEAIQAWLDAFDKLEPLELTDADQKLIAEARRTDREWELAHFDERAEKLRKLFE